MAQAQTVWAAKLDGQVMGEAAPGAMLGKNPHQTRGSAFNVRLMSTLLPAVFADDVRQGLHP